MVNDSFFKRLCLCGMLFSLAAPMPVFADTMAASSSNAERVPDTDIDDAQTEVDDSQLMGDLDLMKGYIEDTYGLTDSETLNLILAYVRNIADSLSGPALASDQEDTEADQEEDIQILSDDVVSYTDLPLPDHDVVLVSGSFGGDQYTVVVPADSYKYLWIGDDHVLYNISGSSVTCRMFQGGTFDPSSYNYTNLTLQPILGNSASTVYNNRYLSYKTYYYQTSNNWGNQLTSSTTYGNFYVDENGVSNQRSLGINYRSYYLLAVLIFLQGVNLLCYWKNLRH